MMKNIQWYGYELSGLTRRGIRSNPDGTQDVVGYSYTLYEGKYANRAARGEVEVISRVTPSDARDIERARVDLDFPHPRSRVGNSDADIRISWVLELVADSVSRRLVATR